MKLKSGIGSGVIDMKKDVKALIKRLTLLVQFGQTGKGWIAVDGNGRVYQYDKKPNFIPSGDSESLDYWNVQQQICLDLSRMDGMPLSMVCPSLTSKDALFYTDGETVWLVEQK